MSIDSTLHSLFGASKLSADILVQEYGKYFGMKTVAFRGGCLTGPAHSGTSLHGFLSYLVKSIATQSTYTIFGYKGKQVRDNIHSYDLVRMFWEFYKKPGYGEIYNAGGGRKNSISILEAINLINKLTKNNYKNYKVVNKNRKGDHIWYVTDFSKFKNKYKKWKITKDIKTTILEIIKTIK